MVDTFDQIVFKTVGSALAEAGHVRLDVFDVKGRRVKTLVNGAAPAGVHRVRFAASSLASGVYYYRIQAEGRSETRRMVLLK